MVTTPAGMPRTPRRLKPAALARIGRDDADDPPRGPVRSDRFFLCPTLTPLSYTAGYHDLEPADQLLYNQLTALMGIEIIGWFEATFRPALLRTASRLAPHGEEADLAKALRQFAADELEHIGWWRDLHIESSKALGLDSGLRVLRISPVGRGAFSMLARSAPRCSAVFWIMLALEEHALQIARRTLAMPANDVDPRHRSAHRHHLRDEARHVQLDRHLIDRFYSSQSRAVRRVNASLFGFILTRYLLPPVRGACQVIDRLAQIRPSVRAQTPVMKRQLQGLMDHGEYCAMMYSPSATPLLFSVLDEHAEMTDLRRRLEIRAPSPKGGTAACR